MKSFYSFKLFPNTETLLKIREPTAAKRTVMKIETTKSKPGDDELFF